MEVRAAAEVRGRTGRVVAAPRRPLTRGPLPACSASLSVGGPAGDDELPGVLSRSLPETFTIGRGNVGSTLVGTPLGHRYAVALGLALVTTRT